MKKIPGNYKGEIILASTVVLLIILTLVINYQNAKLRIAEIRRIMSESTSSTQDIDHAGLIVQYRFRLDLYNKELSEFDADLIEMKAHSMFPVITQQESLTTGIFMPEISALIINTIKSILGKPPLIVNQTNPVNRALETAYYYERNCHFKKALEQYEEALKHELRSGQKGGIMLHQGFCLSMIGRIDQAITIYSSVMEIFPDAPVSVTASVLLEFLKKFSREAEIVKKMPDSPEKMIKLFRLIAFKDSLDVIENISKKQNPKRNLVILLFKARCFESTGKTADALTLYQEILMQSPSSEQAKYANRRLLMISLKSDLAEEGKRLAEKNNSVVRDKTLEFFINKTAKLQALLTDITKHRESVYHNEVKSVIAESEIKFRTSFQYRGKKVKVTTINGDIIIGKVIFEDSLKIVINTIAGEAVVYKNSIKKSELR